MLSRFPSQLAEPGEHLVGAAALGIAPADRVLLRIEHFAFWRDHEQCRGALEVLDPQLLDEIEVGAVFGLRHADIDEGDGVAAAEFSLEPIGLQHPRQGAAIVAPAGPEDDYRQLAVGRGIAE